jgi:hypothetical protein
VLRHLGIPNSVIVLVLVVVAASVLLYRTTFGRSLYATGGSREVARLSGIRVDRIIIGAYVICATLASVAGLVLGGFIGYVDRYLGRGFDLDSVASVVAGGTTFAGGVGGLGGTVAGVLLITVLNNLVLMLNLGVQYQLAVKGVVIIVQLRVFFSLQILICHRCLAPGVSHGILTADRVGQSGRREGSADPHENRPDGQGRPVGGPGSADASGAMKGGESAGNIVSPGGMDHSTFGPQRRTDHWPTLCGFQASIQPRNKDMIP